MANRKALGRGLSSLLPETPPEKEQQETIVFVQVAKISPNPFQPRVKFDPETLAELRQSIAEKGVVQPITVRRADEGYELISGERRLRAIRDLGLEQVPAYIMEVESDEEMIELAVIENIHRQDLNSIEVAKSYRRLIDECHLTQEDVAVKVGKDRATVANLLRLLKLPRRIQESVQNDELSMGHARAVLALENSEDQIAIWKKIIQQNLSVRKVEDLVRKWGKETKNPKKETLPDARSLYLEDVENRLQSQLATKVSVQSKGRGGAIIISYYSDDELERLIGLFSEES